MGEYSHETMQYTFDNGDTVTKEYMENAPREHLEKLFEIHDSKSYDPSIDNINHMRQAMKNATASQNNYNRMLQKTYSAIKFGGISSNLLAPEIIKDSISQTDQENQLPWNDENHWHNKVKLRRRNVVV